MRLIYCIVVLTFILSVAAKADHIRDLQTRAVENGKAEWGHWGADSRRYSSWTSHTNRLIPVYTFGMNLESVRGENSPYRSPDRLQTLYGQVPDGTLNEDADYFDQTDVYRLQQVAVASGAKRVILVVFDGMDWQTTWMAATHRARKVAYDTGRGTGLFFQDYRGTETDFGFFVSSPTNTGAKADVNAQTLVDPGGNQPGGYAWRIAGQTAWATSLDLLYPVGKGRDFSHAYADSASSATSMTSGAKTYNGAVNVDSRGRQIRPIAQQLQTRDFAVGVVTSVPISHATPAAGYANNVNRNDYQDLTRDLLGLPSIAHADAALPGVDVLLGSGWGVSRDADAAQGENFVSGNRYLAKVDLNAARIENGGKYRTVLRTSGVIGSIALAKSAQDAAENRQRLLGFFGVPEGHLPFQTADGHFDPTISPGKNGTTAKAETYSAADVSENPTLPEMTSAALTVLSSRSDRFWLLIEAGDVDWANHANNIDNSIGAVYSGDAAVRTVAEWVESHGGWKDTVMIVTADHGHYFNLIKPAALVPPN